MKKYRIFLLLLILALACTLVACDDGGEEEQQPPVTPSATVTIALDKTELSLVMGQTAVISATISGTEELASWTSSATEVATVTNGKVTAVADGSATITATVDDKSASCAVTVSSQESVVLNRENVRVFKGETAQLSATVMLGLVEQDCAITWSSSDEKYATVDENGVVTGVKNTKKEPVVITATTPSGTTASCAVTVEKIVEIALSQTEVTLHPNGTALTIDDVSKSDTSVQYPQTAAIVVSGWIGGYKATVSGLNWTSSAPDIVKAEIKQDRKGTPYVLLTALKSGNVTISAQAQDSSEVIVCKVESWYAVTTPADLEYMRTDINGVFKLMNDIDFEGAQWDCVTPWAGDSVPDSAYWGGLLDGQGYAIKNINILAGWNKGIIGETNTTSVIRNLSVINLINQDTSNKVGSIVSYNKGLIENCYFENTIQSDSQNNWNSHGGIVATNHMDGTIRNCIVKVTAARTYTNCGAIIGYNCGAVENCYAICTDAILPMYGEWSNTYGYFTDCGVYASEEAFLAAAQLTSYTERVWTNTGLSVPSLYHYPQVSLEKSTIYFAQGNRYTLQTTNLLGIDIDWSISGNEGNIVSCEQNADKTLTFFARSKGAVELSVTLENGSSATVELIVTGVVISPDKEIVAIDYNQPALSDKHAIVLRTETGEIVQENLSFISSDESVATVDENGVITAVGKGICCISVRYIEDDYIDLIEVNVTAWEQISTAAQLQAMKDNYKLNYCLVNDIDFGGNVFEAITPWTTTDSDSLYFSGMFDGNGFTVSNVTIKGDNQGIWGRTATTAIIRNTVFENILFCAKDGSDTQKTAGLVAFNTGIIRDVVVKAKLTAGYGTDYQSVGALCGTNEYRGRMYNCIAYADVSEVTIVPNETVNVGVLMALCQGVAKDCIGVTIGSAASSVAVQSIAYINSNGVVNCNYYSSEKKAVAANAPFGSFSESVWNITSDALPTLKKLA